MLREEFKDFGYSISCTTRPMRAGEIDGEDYFFIGINDFEKMQKAGELAEWAIVHGHLYGTPLAPVESILKSGRDILFDIDVQGAAQLHVSLPQATFVFLLPPSLEELRKRLLMRGSMDESSLNLRMTNALTEMRQAYWYDALIINDDLERAYRELRAVYQSALLAPRCNSAHLQNLLASVNNG